MLANPHIGPGILDPVEIDADALLERLGERTANLIIHGPSLDDLEWFALLSGDGE